MIRIAANKRPDHRVLDGCEGKLSSASWAALGKCSADTALRDINDLLARGVLRKLEGGGQHGVCVMCQTGGWRLWNVH